MLRQCWEFALCLLFMRQVERTDMPKDPAKTVRKPKSVFLPDNTHVLEVERENFEAQHIQTLGIPIFRVFCDSNWAN